jgi:tricarballylate dehydrogenase
VRKRLCGIPKEKAPPLMTAAEKTDEMDKAEARDFDVVVVGTGIAGLSTAVAALQSGASVALLERSAREERGGNTRWTEALLRMKSETEVSDDFEEHFAKNAGHHLDPELVGETTRAHRDWPSIVKTLGFTDPDLVATFAQGVGPTIQWLKTFGVRFDFLPTYFITSSQPRMAPVGGGLALIEALAAFAGDKDARFFYETTARGLVQDEHGVVVGVRAVQQGNKALTLRACSVVLACGGFQGNSEMLTHYIGPRARYIRPVARGGYYDKGEGIRMALEIGAAPCGDYGRFHAEPLDPRSGAPEPIVLVFNYGILVNMDGRRFVDEAPATVDATYEAITRTVLEQPDGIAFVILDSRLDDVPGWRRSVRSDQPPISADSVPELAEKLSLNAGELERTVAAYNAACPPAGAFDPLVADGLATKPGFAPRKSNWSRQLTQPPFLAYPIICGNCFTFGGLKVNSNSQVLNADGEAIPGLYAAGETIGLYYGTYTGATSVLRGDVFGLIAGRHATQAFISR